MRQYFATYKNKEGAYYSCAVDVPETHITGSANETAYNILFEVFKNHNENNPRKQFKNLEDFVVICLTRID